MDFVGGWSARNRLEDKETRAEADAEFESERREFKNKRKPMRSNNAEDDLGSLLGDGISGKLPKYANKITLKVYKLKF